ncbi:MAG: hypothetical protein GXX80_14750 [Thermotogaceae bacterium]|nr:hypothetical protein [Thermotogaceae bacterium]
MKSVETKFEIGDLVCSIYEAENGEINQQEISGIIIRENGDRRYVIGALQYREDQLVSEIEALEIAIQYHKRQERMLQEVLAEKASAQILQTYE